MVDSSGRIIILSALLLIVITITAPLIREITETSFEETTSDIIFRYGTSGAKHQNELDTLKGIFTKDMVNKDPVTTKLELTQEEMDTIYLMMVKIDFFSYPKSFHPELEGNIVTMQTQFPVYYMEYHNQTGTKIVYWTNQYIVPGDTPYQNLKELAQLIIMTIKAKPEYQDLPEPTAGYFQVNCWCNGVAREKRPMETA